jgi:hypothetical protein
MTNQSDIIYYNANMYCQKVNPTDPDQPAIYNQTRNDVLVNDANNYAITFQF